MNQKKNSLTFHGNRVSQNFNPLSNSVTTNAWKKVSKAGNFKNWMDYQKWLLGQVKPINKYKKTV